MITIRMGDDFTRTGDYIKCVVQKMIDALRQIESITVEGAVSDVQVVRCFNGVDLVVDQHSSIDDVVDAWELQMGRQSEEYRNSQEYRDQIEEEKQEYEEDYRKMHERVPDAVTQQEIKGWTDDTMLVDTMYHWNSSGLRLIHEDDFYLIPEGTTLHSISGKSIVKGVDYIDLDTRGNHLAFGLFQVGIRNLDTGTKINLLKNLVSRKG